VTVGAPLSPDKLDHGLVRRSVEGPIVTLKAIWAAAAAAAIMIGCVLPAVASRGEPPSQIEQLEVQR
jgi:hypothetical protein